MSGVWLASYVLLWLLVILLLMTCIALSRQIGLIHRRIPPFPARATTEGPSLGEMMEPLVLRRTGGEAVTIGGGNDHRRLYVFVGANCSTCDELAPSLRSVHKSDGRDVELVLVGVSGSEDENRRFVERNRLEDVPYLLAPEAVPKYGIQGTPFAIVVAEDGTVQAKGVANHLEHLESLIVAKAPTAA